MNRLHCLALAVLSFVLTSYLVGQSVRDLSPTEMNALRGGNGQVAKWTSRCDEYAGQYVGCTKAGAFCQLCGEVNSNGVPVSPMVDFLNNPNPEHLGGYEDKPGAQDCGTIWEGTCAADPNSPGGFVCVARDTGVYCPSAPKVGLQPNVVFNGKNRRFHRSQPARSGV